MKSKLRALDIFGIPFEFKTSGESTYKTIFGGLLTISCLIITVVFTFLFGSNFFFKKNPYVTNQQVYPKDYSDPFLLTNENFLIPWRVTDDNFNIVNVTEIFFPMMIYFEVIKNETGLFVIRQESLESSSCADVNFTIPSLKERDVNNYYCVDWSKHNLSFGGGWDSNRIQFIQFKLNFCEDGKPFSNDNKCTSKEVAQKYLGGSFNSYIEFLYPQYYFDPYDLIEPQKISYYEYWFAMSLDLQKIDRLFFTNEILYDDHGWILTDQKESTLRAAADMKFDYLSYNSDNYGKEGQFSKLYEMNFYSNKKYNVTKRSYMKIQDLTAIIGGFLQGILLIGKCISFIFYETLRNDELVNYLFTFDGDNSHDSHKIHTRRPRVHSDNLQGKAKKYQNGNSFHPKMKFSDKRVVFPQDTPPKKFFEINHDNSANVLPDNSSFHKFKELSFTRMNISNLNNKELEISNIKNKEKAELPRLKLSTTPKKIPHHSNSLFLFKRMVCCCKEKNNQTKIYDYASNYVEKKSDILYYFYVVQSLESMKNVLFNDEQKIFMNHFYKPDLSNTHDFDKFCQNEVSNEHLNFINLIQYLQMKQLNKSLSEYDQKILEIVTNS